MIRIIQDIIIVLVGLALCVEHLNISAGLLVLTPSKTVNALLLAVVGLEWAAGKRSKLPDRKSLWVVFFGAAIFIGMIQSIVAGRQPISALIVAMQYVALILFYFTLVFVLSDRRRITLLLSSVVVSGCFVTVTAAMGLGVHGGGRMGGWGGNVNHFAQNLLICLSLSYGLYVTTKSHTLRLVLLAAVGTMVLGLVNTFSRAGFVAVPLMLALWSVRFRRLDALRYAVPVLAVAIIGWFFLPETVIERLETLSPDEIEKDSSAMSRVTHLRVGLMAFLSNPLIGVGLANFIYWSAAETGGHVGVIHNAYMSVLAELGLFGFIPFMTIIVMSWRDLSRSFTVVRRIGRRRDPDLKWIELQAVMLQVALLSSLVMSLFHPTMTKKMFWMLFATSTALWKLTMDRYHALNPKRGEDAPPIAWEPLKSPAGTESPAPMLRSPPI